jgi:hypothetical protein
MMVFVLLIGFDGPGIDINFALEFGVLDNFAEVFLKLATVLVQCAVEVVLFHGSLTLNAVKIKYVLNLE